MPGNWDTILFDFLHPPKLANPRCSRNPLHPCGPVHLPSGNVAASCQEFTNTRRYYASQQKKPSKANMEGVGSLLFFFCVGRFGVLALLLLVESLNLLVFILEVPEDVGLSEFFTSLRGVDTQTIWWVWTIVFSECISPSIFINWKPHTNKVRLPKRQYFTTYMICRDYSCWRFRHTLVSIVFSWLPKIGSSRFFNAWGGDLILDLAKRMIRYPDLNSNGEKVTHQPWIGVKPLPYSVFCWCKFFRKKHPCGCQLSIHVIWLPCISEVYTHFF